MYESTFIIAGHGVYAILGNGFYINFISSSFLNQFDSCEVNVI